MTPKIFLDANILFSAAYTANSRIASLFDLARLGACDLITSTFALEEARRNLAAKQPKGLPRLKAFMIEIEVVGGAPERLVQGLKEYLPEKDRPILAAAIIAGAAWLMTGDRQHFGDLYGKVISGVEVLEPSEVLERLVA